MHKSYIIILIILATLFVVKYTEKDNYAQSYTQLNSKSHFFNENMVIESTKHDIFTNTNLKNHISLIFFGYTNCPDYCPDTLAKLNKIFKNLNINIESTPLQVLFISVDLENDDIVTLRKYVEYFNKDFIGLSMSPKTLEELTKSVGVYFKKVSSTDDIDFYDHTGAVFIVGKDSRLMGIYSPPFNEKNIKNDITQLLSLND